MIVEGVKFSRIDGLDRCIYKTIHAKGIFVVWSFVGMFHQQVVAINRPEVIVYVFVFYAKTILFQVKIKIFIDLLKRFRS